MRTMRGPVYRWMRFLKQGANKKKVHGPSWDEQSRSLTLDSILGQW